MRDLSWYQAFSFLILVRGSGELLADDPGERETFRRISSTTGQAWEKSPGRSYSFTTIYAHPDQQNILNGAMSGIRVWP
jgi:hypothetical protein